MNELVLANRAADWRRLKMLVLDSVSSPITKCWREPSPARNAHVCVHAAVQRPVNYRVGTFTRVPSRPISLRRPPV